MSSPPLPRKPIRFGLFELNLETQQLRKAGTLLRMQPQPLKVLMALISRRGETVTREELRRELWGDGTFVDFEQGLNYCIRQIRTCLGDEAQSPRYVETVPRRGYRFIALIEASGEYPDPIAEVAPRATIRRAPRFLPWAIALAVLPVAAALVAIGWWVHSPGRPNFTERDTILITDFSNSTGDNLFDGTLRRALSVDLSQSPYLNILSDDRIRQVLRLMNRPVHTRIEPDIGREVCLRTGAKAMLTGSVFTMGNQYVLTLEAINAGSGDTLAEERAEARGKEQVLSALGRAAERMRKKLGESLSSIQQFGKPLEQVTTSSLEALQLYSLGMEKRSEGEYESVQFFQGAIQLDPQFALAHASLATVYLNLEQLALAGQHEQKAIALKDRVSERERLYIAAHHFVLIGQAEQVILTYETYRRLYPRDSIPEANLATEYNSLGRFDKALEHSLNGIRLSPDNPGILAELASAYLGLGRTADARAAIAAGLKGNPSSEGLHLAMSNIALAQGDHETRRREDALLKATPSGTLSLLYRDAALSASRGRLHEAEGLYQQASQLALKLGLTDNASFALALQAVYEAYLLWPAAAKESVQKALELSQMSDTIEPAAVALAASGETRQAEALIGKLARDRPDDTVVQFVWVPTIQALASLRRGDADQAVSRLGSAVPYDRGNLDSALVRANALLRSRRGREAAGEFRRILEQQMRSPSDPVCSLAQLGLARAYAQIGQKGLSRAAYEKFLTTWQDADPDLPALQQAKDEYREVK